jgi:hypothetical protein
MASYAKWWDESTTTERREKLIMWGVRVYVGKGGLRFEYGEEFPARVQMTEISFDGSIERRQAPDTVSVVLGSDGRTAELTTYGGEGVTFPLRWGAQAVALAA